MSTRTLTVLRGVSFAMFLGALVLLLRVLPLQRLPAVAQAWIDGLGAVGRLRSG